MQPADDHYAAASCTHDRHAPPATMMPAAMQPGVKKPAMDECGLNFTGANEADDEEMCIMIGSSVGAMVSGGCRPIPAKHVM